MFCSCAKTVEYICSGTDSWWNVQVYTFKFILKDFDHIFRRATIQKRLSSQTAISVEHLSVAVSVFCIVYQLETSSNILIYIHPTITNVVKTWRTPMRFIMLQWTGMVTPLSYNYVISSFLVILSPYMKKSYQKVERY